LDIGTIHRLWERAWPSAGCARWLPAACTVQAGCRLPRRLADLASRFPQSLVSPSRAVVLRRSRTLLAGVSSAQRQFLSAGPNSLAKSTTYAPQLSFSVVFP